VIGVDGQAKSLSQEGRIARLRKVY
jgi:hypothetical protein